MFRLTKQLTLGSKRCLKRECRRGVMSNRQLKKRVPVKQIHDDLAKQRQMEENPRPLQFTPDGDVSKLPFSIRRSGPAQNLPVYLDYKNGGTRVVTILRKCQGDLNILSDEFKKVCNESPTKLYNGRIEAKGDHKKNVMRWLSELGF